MSQPNNSMTIWGWAEPQICAVDECSTVIDHSNLFIYCEIHVPEGKFGTTELLYDLARGQTCIQDARGLLLACGHAPEAVEEAIDTLINDPNTTVRATNTAWPRNTNIFVIPNS